MRKFALVAVVALLLLALTAAPAAAGDCTVSPDPVPVGTDFTITATGLTPVAWYAITVSQGGGNVAHPQDFRQTDPAGAFSYTRNTFLPGTQELHAGAARVRIDGASFDPTAQGTARCSFTIV